VIYIRAHERGQKDSGTTIGKQTNKQIMIKVDKLLELLETTELIERRSSVS
jgi:hypothetical protein